MANGKEHDDMDVEDARAEQRPATRRLMSTVETANGKSTKGRGSNFQNDDRMTGHFDRLDNSQDTSVAQKWVHSEASTEDIQDAFADYGAVKNTWLNLDRQTGFVKGYALVEYGSKEEAEAAIENLDGVEILGEAISVSWAFVKPAVGRRGPPRRR